MGAGQQREYLLAANGVVEDQQQLPASQPAPPQRHPRLHPGRDLRGRNPRRQQQAGQRVVRVDRLPSGGVPVQRQEELAVGEVPGQPVRGVHREGRLADPGHAADRVDGDHPTTSRHAGQRPRQLGQLSLPAGEGGDIARQRPGRRGLEGSRRLALPGRQHLCGRSASARGGDEQRAHRLGQAQRIGQQAGRVPVGGTVDSPFQVADRPR